MISPQRDQTVKLNLYGELPADEFYCSVQLLNRHGEPVASRRIRIRKMDHCSCALHCSCVCVGDVNGTGCRPISPELYRAAGFRGAIPAVPPKRGFFSNVPVDVLLFVVSLILLLLIVGFFKWLIGLYIPVVSRWGLNSLLATGEMSEYFEQALKCKCAVKDERDASVHPDMNKKTVRIYSRKAEFLLNTTFFLVYPLAVCRRRGLAKSSPSVRGHRCSDGSKISLKSEKSEHPEVICVSTYGDSRDSKMEAEDTEYVMNELKKSEESLRSHSRSKVSETKK